MISLLSGVIYKNNSLESVTGTCRAGLFPNFSVAISLAAQIRPNFQQELQPMNTIVTTQYGSLEGYEKNGLVYFRGIPYAQAPVGDLRFRAPQKPSAWDGVREAKNSGDAAPQNKGFVAMVDTIGEDCLHLNIATPSADSKKRPVMFWIHGGSFTTGSGEQSLYLEGSLPLDQDTVLVTINYRLGVMGFVNFSGLVNHAEQSFDSNIGLSDMIAALEWVKDNIEVFGGDPDNITVFGESAGGMGVSCLLGSPKAKGLFNKAIVQSGGAHMTTLPEDAKRVAETLLGTLNINPNELSKLKELSMEELLKAQENMPDVKFSNEGRTNRLPVSSFPFLPTIGDDILPEDPLLAIEAGNAKDIPIMVGTNLHEWNFFVQLSDPNKNNLDRDSLLKVVKSRVPGHAEDAVDCYYDDEGRAKAVDVFSAIESDRFFRIPSIRLLEAQLKHQAQCYSYLFTYEASFLDGKLGSCHVIEIPFVLGSYQDNFAKLLLGESEKICELSEKCVEAWASFARSGQPSSSQLPEWQAYDENQRATMELGEQCSALKDPMSAQRQFWEGLL